DYHILTLICVFLFIILDYHILTLICVFLIYNPRLHIKMYKKKYLMPYKLLFFIFLILSPKLIHAQSCSNLQHTASNAPSPGIPGASIIVINNSGQSMSYATSSLETGKWITPECDPAKFKTVPNGQILNIAAISNGVTPGTYTGTKGSITYNIIDGSPPTSITITWDTPLFGNKYDTKDYDTAKYVVETKVSGPGNELYTVTVGKK
ncbi:hypothetical protein C1646_793053, partial [Rhizophagus diaphanus]